MDENKPMHASARPRARRWLLIAIAGLYLVSVPWYRTPDASPSIWLGLPSWVAVALICYAGAAVLNAFAWFWTPIDDNASVEIGSASGDRGRNGSL